MRVQKNQFFFGLELTRAGTELPDVMTSKRRIKCERGAFSSESEQKCTAVIMINGELKQYEFALKFVD